MKQQQRSTPTQIAEDSSNQTAGRPTPNAEPVESNRANNFPQSKPIRGILRFAEPTAVEARKRQLEMQRKFAVIYR